MALNSETRGDIETAIDSWVENPEINVGYINMAHPSNSASHDYVVGFIHGNLVQLSMDIVIANQGRNPTKKEREDIYRLLWKRIPEIEDSITSFEEYARDHADDDSDEDLDDDDELDE